MYRTAAQPSAHLLAPRAWPQELEFLYRNTRSIEVAVEDDMRANLQALGFRVVGRGVPHDDWNVLANVSAGPPPAARTDSRLLHRKHSEHLPQ